MRICDNLPLVLKMRFQAFSYKTVSQFFESLIFSQDILGNVHHIREINLQEKPFISRAKLIKRNLRHGFVDQRQLKMIMPE